MKSLDPRMNRLDLQREGEIPQAKEREYWPTYEVFVQAKRGKKHEHAGTVHAPDAEMALVLAKEQFGRRMTVSNMWVVNTSDIFAFHYDDEDMFATNSEKLHREAAGFKSRGRIDEYKKKIAGSK